VLFSFCCLKPVNGTVRKTEEGGGCWLADTSEKLLEWNRALITYFPIEVTDKSRQPGCLLHGDPWLSDTVSRRLWLYQLSVSDRKAGICLA
jgi:hypothetical protein